MSHECQVKGIWTEGAASALWCREPPTTSDGTGASDSGPCGPPQGPGGCLLTKERTCFSTSKWQGVYSILAF